MKSDFFMFIKTSPYIQNDTFAVMVLILDKIAKLHPSNSKLELNIGLLFGIGKRITLSFNLSKEPKYCIP